MCALNSVFSDVTPGAGHRPRGSVWLSDTYQHAMPAKQVEQVLSR